MEKERPKVVYNGEREAELLKKLCELEPATEHLMSNVKLSQPAGILVISSEYDDSWVAMNQVYHGWNIVRSA